MQGKLRQKNEEEVPEMGLVASIENLIQNQELLERQRNDGSNDSRQTLNQMEKWNASKTKLTFTHNANQTQQHSEPAASMPTEVHDAQEAEVHQQIGKDRGEREANVVKIEIMLSLADNVGKDHALKDKTSITGMAQRAHLT